MRKTLLGLLAMTLLSGAVPLSSFAGVVIGVSISVAPPVLPVYVQPPCPGIGFIWTPGYWAWGSDDYYWVPGTWVAAPAPGLLWTPGYWGWASGAYVWHVGYWGPHVGFYGGVNYGFGYGGVGFEGGHWRDGAFFYNRAVSNLGTLQVTNIYNTPVSVHNVTINRVSYNGGTGGTVARPTDFELRAANERHIEATSLQSRQERLAMSRPDARASVNGGRPSIAATARAGEFTARSGNAAHEGGPPHGPAQQRFDRPPQAQHGNGYAGGSPQPQAGHPGSPGPGSQGHAPHGAPGGGPGHGQPPHAHEHGGGHGEREERR